MGLAVATGTQIEIVHGWGRKQSPALSAQIETIDAGGNVRGLAVGFLWNRDGNKQLATLSQDRNAPHLAAGQLGTRPFNDAEIAERARARLEQEPENAGGCGSGCGLGRPLGRSDG